MNALTGVEGALLGLLSGVVSKVFWDWMASGRAKKVDPYITIKDCERHRRAWGQNERNISAHSVRIRTAEKRLDQGLRDFEEIKKELAIIKETIAKILTILKKDI